MYVISKLAGTEGAFLSSIDRYKPQAKLREINRVWGTEMKNGLRVLKQTIDCQRASGEREKIVLRSNCQVVLGLGSHE